MTQPYKLYCKLPLSNGGVAIVDAEDFERVSIYPWHQHKGYAVYSTTHANGKRDAGRLHRLIMNAPKGVIVDHINGDRLDNRKENLRFCDDFGNSRNAGIRKDASSGFKGITLHKDINKWQAGIKIKGRRIHLGCYDTKVEAAKAYDKAAIKYYGEFAKTNAQMGLYETNI